MTPALPLMLALSLFCVVGCEAPAPRYGKVVVHDRDVDVRIIFNERDRIIIRDWYASRHHSLPPGLAKQGKLPPGHAKRWAPRDTLPPGLAYRSLPVELERRLSPLPDGYVRVIIGSDIVLINTRTRVIFDILYDIAAD